MARRSFLGQPRFYGARLRATRHGGGSVSALLPYQTAATYAYLAADDRLLTLNGNVGRVDLSLPASALSSPHGNRPNAARVA